MGVSEMMTPFAQEEPLPGVPVQLKGLGTTGTRTKGSCLDVQASLSFAQKCFTNKLHKPSMHRR
jgi:hypothetical protein